MCWATSVSSFLTAFYKMYILRARVPINKLIKQHFGWVSIGSVPHDLVALTTVLPASQHNLRRNKNGILFSHPERSTERSRVRLQSYGTSCHSSCEVHLPLTFLNQSLKRFYIKSPSLNIHTSLIYIVHVPIVFLML